MPCVFCICHKVSNQHLSWLVLCLTVLVDVSNVCEVQKWVKAMIKDEKE